MPDIPPKRPRAAPPKTLPRSAMTDRGVEVDLYGMLKDMSDLTARMGVQERGLEDLRREMRANSEAHTAKLSAIDQHLLKQDLLVKQSQEETDRKHNEILTTLEGNSGATAARLRAELEAEFAPQSAFIHTLQDKQARQEEEARVKAAIEQAAQAHRDQTFTYIRNLSISGFLLLVSGGLERVAGIPAWAYLAALGGVGVFMLYTVIFLRTSAPAAPTPPPMPGKEVAE